MLTLGLCLLGVAVSGRGAELVLVWDAPTEAVDGRPLTNDIAYRVHCGVTPGGVCPVVDTVATNACCLPGLHPHSNYYVRVVVLGPQGLESAFSEEFVWAHDGDRDALPDAWERRYFGDIARPGTGREDDYDGDGAVNYDEFVAGTDPSCMHDVARTVVSREGTNTVVSYQVRTARGPGYLDKVRTYALEQTYDLAAGVWGPAPGGGEEVAEEDAVVAHVLPADGAPVFVRTRIALRDRDE